MDTAIRHFTKNPIHGYVLLFLKYINNTCHNRNILFSPSRHSFFIFSAQPKLAIHIKSRNPNTLLNPLSHQSTPAATAPCSRRHPPQLLSIVTALFCSPSSTPSPTVAAGSTRVICCHCRIRLSRCTPPLPLSPTRRLYLSPLRCRIAPLSPRSCRLVVAPRHSIDPSHCRAIGGRVSTWAVASLLSRPRPSPLIFPPPQPRPHPQIPHDVEPPPVAALLGPNVPRSGIWWPNTYLAKYPIYSYLFFTDTSWIRIHRVCDTYLYEIRIQDVSTG
jgi:hypothetical protein